MIKSLPAYVFENELSKPLIQDNESPVCSVNTVGETQKGTTVPMHPVVGQPNLPLNYNTTQVKPQFGLEDLDVVGLFLTNLKENTSLSIDEDKTEYVIKEASNLVALFFALKEVQSFPQFASIIYLYAGTHYEKSVAVSVCSYFNELFAKEKQEETEIEPQAPIERPAWLAVLTDAHNNWHMCRTNKAFSQLSKLLGLLVTVGLCDAASIQFTIGGFKLFDDQIIKEHVSAASLVDAIFSTVTFFAEGAYLCFKHGSIRPLIMSDFKILDIDEQYARAVGWWDLVRAGNFEKVMGKVDSEYESLLTELSTAIKAMIPLTKGIENKLLNDKFLRVLQMENDYVTHKIACGVRRAPFCIEIFGESAQGKTTFGDQLIDYLMIGQGLPAGKEFRAVHDPQDKFMSTWKTNKNVMIINDCGNDKSQFLQKPPTRDIINFANNQVFVAPKAELAEKGRVFLEPELMVVDTNVKNLCAFESSNCPYSVQRRMHVVVTLKVKRELQRVVDGVTCGIDSKKVREKYTIDGVYTPPLVDDIWIVDIEQAVKPERMCDIADYKPLYMDGVKMVDLSTKDAFHYISLLFNEHRQDQFCIIESMKERAHTMEKCPHEGCFHIKGMCKLHPEAQTGFELGSYATMGLMTCYSVVKSKFVGDASTYALPFEKMATDQLIKLTNKLIDNWDWMCIIPTPVMEHKYFKAFCLWNYADEIKNRYKSALLFQVFLSALCWYFLGRWTVFFNAIYFMYLVVTLIDTLKVQMLEELKNRNNQVEASIKATRDDHVRTFCNLSVLAGIIVSLAFAWKVWKASQVEKQGDLTPKTKEDIAKRDTEINVWCGVEATPLPITDLSKTVTSEVLTKLVQKNLVYGSVKKGDEPARMVNGLMLTTNVVLLPYHYFEKDDSLNFTFNKSEPDKCGNKFSCVISKNMMYRIPDTDLCIAYTGTGGSFRNLTKHFPLDEMRNHPFILQWRGKDGNLLTYKGMSRVTMATNNTKHEDKILMFKGGYYEKLSGNTFGGMCGAILVSDTKGSVISGIHLGGVKDTPRGCYGSLTQAILELAVNELNKKEALIVPSESGIFEPHSMGCELVTKEPLHPKSPINFLPENAQISYYGSCTGKVSSFSDVRNLPISDVVTEVTGVENIWGAPKMKPEWFGWSTTLQNLSNPAEQFDHELLIKAVKDYKKPLVELISSNLWVGIKPLTDTQNVNGIPGCKFIDGIKKSTSIGHPLVGPKRNHMEEIVEGEFVFTPLIMQEIDRYINCYKSGKRAWAIAKGCKKDEVLPVAKGKCRVFYGNPIALTFLIRRYFLPIIRFIQMNPLLAECAVGINSHGKDWEEFHQYVLKFGEERIIGGDYGKYDQKLPSQLLFASLRVLIDLAAAAGYSEEDIYIMKMMTTDIVYALVAFNGDLISLNCGGHISGNSLTVILNSISGSLNLRCYFFSNYDSEFREAVALSTYGDDNIGSVKEGFDNFNIKGASEFLGKYGQTYTMPDKNSELTAYLPYEQFEFLKRKSVFHPKLNRHIGALVPGSIFKSLHCCLRRKGHPLTGQELSALNVDTALREWFNHGEEIYEQRRKELKEIALKTDIEHMCLGLDLTYDERVIDWEDRYIRKIKPEYVSNTDDDVSDLE